MATYSYIIEKRNDRKRKTISQNADTRECDENG